jgi:hypothetical protein
MYMELSSSLVNDPSALSEIFTLSLHSGHVTHARHTDSLFMSGTEWYGAPSLGAGGMIPNVSGREMYGIVQTHTHLDR